MRWNHNRLQLGALLLAALVPALVFVGLRVRINFSSPSAPRGLYVLTDPELEHGRLVVLCLPEALGRLGRERGYLEAGPCPGKAAAVLKRLAALPGDEVEVSSEGLAVNGSALPRTARLQCDRRGRPIPAVVPGRYQVGAGTVWVFSDHVPNSWDSRYFGPVGLEGVISGARPLVVGTWRSAPRAPLSPSTCPE